MSYHHNPSLPTQQVTVGLAYQPQPRPVAGPYGKDGAPASRFMKPIPTAHQHPIHGSPSKLNIAKSQPKPVQQRYCPPSHSPPSSMRTHRAAPSPPQQPLSQQQLKPLQLNHQQLLPPRAAFVEPQSPTKSIHSFDSTRSLINHSNNPDKIYKDLESNRKQSNQLDQSQSYQSEWLKKHNQTRNKFKFFMGIVGFITILIIIIIIVKLVGRKSGHSAPAPLNWANGADSIPQFARNTTASSFNRNAS